MNLTIPEGICSRWTRMVPDQESKWSIVRGRSKWIEPRRRGWVSQRESKSRGNFVIRWFDLTGLGEQATD